MVTRLQYHVTGHPGLPGLSTLNFIGDADAASVPTITSRIEATWTELLARINDDVTITGSGVATIIDDQTGVVTAQHPAPAWSVQGTAPSDPLPLGTQGLLLLRTGVYVGGREVRGRVFLPSPVEVDSGGNGMPNPTYLQAGIDAFDTNLWAPPDFQLGVYSATYNQMLPLSAIQGSAQWARLSTRQR